MESRQPLKRRLRGMGAIVVSGVRLGRRGRPILSDVDLVVEPGERVCLLGPSGSGKTALLRVIAGLETPDSGVVTIDGSPPEPGRPDVTMVPQDHPVYGHRDVRGNLGFPFLGERDIDAEVESLADRFALDDLLSRSVDSLSAGERKAVATARALARRDVSVVLLDEPGQGVDLSLRRRFLEVIMSRPGRTVVFATRLPDEALRWADRVVVLVAGSVHQVASPREVHFRPASLEAATAMGELNRFPGTVESRDGRIRVAGSVLTVHPVPSGIEPGQHVVVGVRPLDLTPAGREVPFHERLRATVGRVSHVGAKQRVEFGLGIEPSAVFVAEFESATDFVVGYRIDWHVPPEAVRLYDPVSGRAL